MYRRMQWLYYSVLLLLTFRISVYSLLEGEQCYHDKKGVSGICKTLPSCLSAVKELKSGVTPQNCGIQGSTVLVCCTSSAVLTMTAVFSSKPPSTVADHLLVGEKSRQACRSYEQLAYTTLVPFSLIFDGESELVQNCPWDFAALPLIIANKVMQGQFSHMALIGYRTPEEPAWLCDGTLISDRFVLTAAHCLSAKAYGEPKFVRLGDLNYLDPDDDEYAQQIHVKKVHPHPDYEFPARYNDIALLELDKPAKLSEYLIPGCLFVNDTINERGVITGWSGTEDGNELQRMFTKIANPERCNETWTGSKKILPRGIDKNLQICYGFEHSSPCLDKTGGPIQIYSPDVYCNYEIFGIKSFEGDCYRLNAPSVYVRIGPYIEWIESIVWP